MEQMLKQILEGQAEISKRLESIEDEIRLGENYQMIKGLQHWTETIDAKIDSLLNNTASKDSISQINKKLDRIAGDVNFLIRKTSEHDDDIREIKLAK